MSNKKTSDYLEYFSSNFANFSLSTYVSKYPQSLQAQDLLYTTEAPILAVLSGPKTKNPELNALALPDQILRLPHLGHSFITININIWKHKFCYNIFGGIF